MTVPTDQFIQEQEHLHISNYLSTKHQYTDHEIDEFWNYIFDRVDEDLIKRDTE